MIAQCIIPRDRFGDEYKIGHDPAYHAERTEFRAEEEPWFQLVLCQHGTIGPWGDDYLLACTRNRGSVATRLETLDCVEVVQDGDDGINVKFHINDFEVVAEIMRPRRRRRGRQMTPEETTKLVEAGRKHRFHTGRHREKTTRSRVADVR